MPIVIVLMGILLACAYGAGFHLWRGGSFRRLVLFLLLAQAGFWLGDFLGWEWNWVFGALGILNVGMGTLGAAIFLLAGDFVNRIQIK